MAVYPGSKARTDERTDASTDGRTDGWMRTKQYAISLMICVHWGKPRATQAVFCHRFNLHVFYYINTSSCSWNDKWIRAKFTVSAFVVFQPTVVTWTVLRHLYDVSWPLYGKFINWYQKAVIGTLSTFSVLFLLPLLLLLFCFGSVIWFCLYFERRPNYFGLPTGQCSVLDATHILYSLTNTYVQPLTATTLECTVCDRCFFEFIMRRTTL